MNSQQPRCPRCGGAFEGAGLCPYCHQGIRFAGMGFEAKPTALPCPICPGQTLHQIRFRDVVIDVCAGCGGSWFDLGEIEQVVAAGRVEAKTGLFVPTAIDPQTPPAVRERAYVNCPHCGKLMNNRNWERRSGIIVDWCKLHGVWLDGGELARMRSWAAATPEGPPVEIPEPVARDLPPARDLPLMEGLEFPGRRIRVGGALDGIANVLTRLLFGF